MATLTAASAAKETTTTGEHRKGELRLLFTLFIVNSALVMYVLWDDVVFVTSAGVSNVVVGYQLGRLFGCWGPRTGRGRRWLDACICFIFVSLVVIQVLARSARTTPTSLPSPSVPVLVAAACAAALGIGGCCAYMLDRRSGSSKQQRQEGIFFPLRQNPHTVD